MRDRVFRSERFDQTFINSFFEIQPTRDLSLEFDLNFSDRVDFAFFDPADPDAARQGDEMNWEVEMRYNIGRRVRLDLSHEQRDLEIGEGRLFLAALSQMRLAFQMNRRTFVRAIVQYQDVERDISLYPACVADPAGCGLRPASQNLFTQLLFSYKVNPQTAVFVGYTDSRSGLERFVDDPAAPAGPALRDEIDLTRTDQTFFFKIGYAFVR